MGVGVGGYVCVGVGWRVCVCVCAHVCVCVQVSAVRWRSVFTTTGRPRPAGNISVKTVRGGAYILSGKLKIHVQNLDHN